jgi:hypothetical protein
VAAEGVCWDHADRPVELSQEPGMWVISLEHRSVTQCRIDYGFVLIINGDGMISSCGSIAL